MATKTEIKTKYESYYTNFTNVENVQVINIENTLTTLVLSRIGNMYGEISEEQKAALANTIITNDGVMVKELRAKLQRLNMLIIILPIESDTLFGNFTAFCPNSSTDEVDGAYMSSIIGEQFRSNMKVQMKMMRLKVLEALEIAISLDIDIPEIDPLITLVDRFNEFISYEVE